MNAPYFTAASRDSVVASITRAVIETAKGVRECPSSNGLGQSELFRDGGSGSLELEFRRLSTDVAIVAV